MENPAPRRGARAAGTHGEAGTHGTVEREHGATADAPAAGTQSAAAHPGGGRRLLSAKVVWPVIAALGFGCYTIWIDHTGGSSGGHAALLGLIAAVVTGALGLVLVHFQHTMITDTRALAYGALFGASMGWLYNLSGPSVLKSSGWGLVMGAVMFVVSLYIFRGHRVREPHGLHRNRKQHTHGHGHGTPHGAH
ncbi:hypothetical protein [Streptomyces catenulae]|uniref:Integral membrane protein n=1 Tax=Streptomyces catenulae TaxID=66875 RepID=A0ABV2Z434_9ACTN|nr:hypothetical protein [Streptomyces catenulae]